MMLMKEFFPSTNVSQEADSSSFFGLDRFGVTGKRNVIIVPATCLSHASELLTSHTDAKMNFNSLPCSCPFLKVRMTWLLCDLSSGLYIAES